MAFKWDDLFKYDTTFNPQYPAQTQADPMVGRNRFSMLDMPEYNDAPLRRYTEYLGTEPTRDQYRPGKFSTVLNSLSGGLEAMTSGSIGRGVQLYEGLRDRPFNDAYETWKARGAKVKAEADLENQSYQRRVGAYDKAQQRSLEERRISNAEDTTDIARNRYELQLRQFENGGWDVKPSGAGTYMATRVNPNTGQVETQDTGVKINDLTPDQRIQENNKDRSVSVGNNMRSVGASRYNTDMTRENAVMRDATQRYEGQKDREVRRELWNTPSASVVASKTVGPPTATDLRTPVGLLQKGFPEFNSPDLVRMKGSVIEFQQDPQKIKTKLREMAKGDEDEYMRLATRYKDMITQLQQYPTRGK